MNTYENAVYTLNAYKMTVYVADGKIILQTKKQEEAIPISKIQSVSIRDPKGLQYGVITLYTAQAATSSLNVGLGVSVAGGAERQILFAKTETETAHMVSDYISNYAASPTSGQSPEGVVSVVEEIRGLKQLLDEGILTQEEFDAKKKQLLGI